MHENPYQSPETTSTPRKRRTHRQLGLLVLLMGIVIILREGCTLLAIP